MMQDRKEYRKNFNASGQLYVSGEILDFKCYDVSVNGLLAEIIPGSLLVDISDFEALLRENGSAEIYVKKLMLTGEVDIAWAKQDDGKIMLGLEFIDVMYNVDKMWRKRQYYRSNKNFVGYLIADDKKIDFKGINISMDGLAVKITVSDEDNILKPGYVVKLMVNNLDIKGLGKIIWMESLDEQSCIVGLRYLAIE
ncbi:MAG: PilZ domain-containing protein [Methylococcales bacterium]|nr:PilZ domain-containing protein [Methylococcales bacterium]